jgi:photosystem II stability/assembly factor-like uncharacterized protein
VPIAIGSPTAIAFFDERHGLVAGVVTGLGPPQAAIGSTADGGRHWQIGLGAGYESPLTVAVAATATAWATVRAYPHRAPCEDLLLYSPNRGHAWQSPLPTDSPVAGIAAVSFADPMDGWGIPPPAAAGAPPELVHNVDGGKTWRDVPAPCDLTLGATVAGVSAPTADTVCVLCVSQPGGGRQGKSVLVSSDGGQSWQPQVSVPFLSSGPVGGLGPLGYPTGIFFLADGRGYLWTPPTVTADTRR